MIPANLDAAIRTCVRVAEYDCVSGFEAARLRDAAAALTALKKQNDEQAFLMTLASAHRDELEAQIAALRADAERIDWLQTRLLGAEFNYEGISKCALIFDWPEYARVSADLRATIDAAREAKP